MPAGSTGQWPLDGSRGSRIALRLSHRDQNLVPKGTRNFGRPVAQRQHSRDVGLLVVLRKATGEDTVFLDRSDPVTFDGALDGISAVYLVPPSDVPRLMRAVTPILKRTLEVGVEHFAMLSAS